MQHNFFLLSSIHKLTPNKFGVTLKPKLVIINGFLTLLCHPFCSWLPASSNRHHWLQCAIGQGDAIGFKTLLHNQPGCALPVCCKCRQPRDSIPWYISTQCHHRNTSPCGPKSRSARQKFSDISVLASPGLVCVAIHQTSTPKVLKILSKTLHFAG